MIKQAFISVSDTTNIVNFSKELSTLCIIENIDIDGYTMLRSATKNYRDIVVLCDPVDYSSALAEIKTENRSILYEEKL